MMSHPFYMTYLRLFTPVILLLFFSCGSTETPLDADTRKAIDSISVERIRVVRSGLDSVCKQERITVLPHLVDSLRQQRISEIEKQLKTVPR